MGVEKSASDFSLLFFRVGIGEREKKFHYLTPLFFSFPLPPFLSFLFPFICSVSLACLLPLLTKGGGRGKEPLFFSPEKLILLQRKYSRGIVNSTVLNYHKSSTMVKTAVIGGSEDSYESTSTRVQKILLLLTTDLNVRSLCTVCVQRDRERGKISVVRRKANDSLRCRKEFIHSTGSGTDICQLALWQDDRRWRRGAAAPVADRSLGKRKNAFAKSSTALPDDAKLGETEKASLSTN